VSKLIFKTNGGKALIFGYARVSTKGQRDKGNSLEDQQQRLHEAGAQEIVIEQYTGTTTHRPKFDELLQKLKSGDTLKVTKLDRFARTAAEGSSLVKKLLDRGVSVHILNMGLIDDTATGRLIVNILLSFAEFERDMIVERTQAGKEIARTKEGYREGRPPIEEARKKHAVDMIMTKHSYKETAEATGLSKSTIIRAVRARRAETM
jgi:DNA invertase Pin-like site-specific DNA recombinase